MLKKYKNAFMAVLKENDMDSSLFRHIEKEVENYPAFILRLESTPLFFMARTDIDDFHSFDCRYIRFAPNFPKSDYYPNNTYRNWMDIDSLLNNFEYWLKEEVKPYLEEIEAPDLWEQFKNSSITQIKFEESDSHKSFNKSEKENIRSALEKFKIELLTTYKPPNSEIKIITEKISYLSKKLDELNRFDWQGVAISTIISMSVSLNLDTEKGKILFSMFKKAFKYAFDLLV
ncbi:MAG: hypothetical protein KKG99_12465 [Bacteroidetes bacterium]|nr:hypothetical protein [Bacteroidota bacterium]